MAPPVTVDFHAHAQSPKAAELIAKAPNNPGAEPNPHNEHLQRTRYHAAFTDLSLDSLHLKGIEIGTRAEDVDLDDPRLDPLWTVAQARQAPVFIHPAGTTLGKRVAKYYLTNIIGNPLDTTIALTNLIFGGVLERFPTLRVVAAHGGGYLPSYFARSHHGYEVRPELRTIPHEPGHYLRRVWVDNLVYQPEYLAHVINVIGPTQVVLGTDYPFDMGQDNPVDLLEAVGGLSPADLAAIKGQNALRLLGVPA